MSLETPTPVVGLGAQIWNTLRLAFPVTVARAALLVLVTVDVAMTGHAGAEQLAFYAIANSSQIVLVLVGIGLLQGTTILTSQSYGANEHHHCGVLWRIGMIHSLEREFRPMSELKQLFPSPVDIMVAGHTHQERLEYRDEVVLLNSGSITFPHHKELRLGTVGLLDLRPGTLHAEIIPLGDTPGRPNPGSAMVLDIPDISSDSSSTVI